MSLQNELNRAQPIVDGLNAAIRENPLAAGLIGAGIAWMLMGGTKGMGAIAGATKGAAVMSGSAAASAGARVASAGARAGSGISSAAAQAVDSIKNLASGVSDSVGSIVPDVTEAVDEVNSTAYDAKSAAGEQWNAAAESGRSYGGVLQSRLSESLARQPLLLGAIGLVVGAGVASAFATTSVEREWMGEHGAAARDKLNDIAGQAKDLASNVVSDLKDEAKKQGFTSDVAAKAAGDIADKVKSVAGEARNSMSQTQGPMPQGQSSPMSQAGRFAGVHTPLK
jgi:hypothetical protein